MLADPYATQVLNPTVHARLVADIETYAQDARIQPSHIWTPLSSVCGKVELDYVRRFKFHKGEDRFGLAFVGQGLDADVDGRMHAIAGALVRNFVRARVMVMSQLFDALDDEGIPEMSALLLPNFHTHSIAANAKSFYKIANVLDVLMFRRQAGLQTIVYVSDLDKAGIDYGSGVRRLIQQYYIQVQV